MTTNPTFHIENERKKLPTKKIVRSEQFYTTIILSTICMVKLYYFC